MANAPGWLTARPIAHRGLHKQAAGIIENSLSAAAAAVRHDFAIECDVQLSHDGEALVFHDDTLERLTGATGVIHGLTSAEAARTALKGSRDHIPTLASLLALLNGQVPLICEIKSAFDANTRLADRVHAIAQHYKGPLAFKSFDPAMLIRLRELECPRPLGIVAEAHYDDPEWDFLSAATKRDLANLVHFPQTRPDFLSFWVQDLPSTASVLFRYGLHLPVMSWTVRTAEQRIHAARHADQMVFEGFVPK